MLRLYHNPVMMAAILSDMAVHAQACLLITGSWPGSELTDEEAFPSFSRGKEVAQILLSQVTKSLIQNIFLNV